MNLKVGSQIQTVQAAWAVPQCGNRVETLKWNWQYVCNYSSYMSNKEGDVYHQWYDGVNFQPRKSHQEGSWFSSRESMGSLKVELLIPSQGVQPHVQGKAWMKQEVKIVQLLWMIEAASARILMGRNLK